MLDVPCNHCVEVEGLFGRWVPTTLVLDADFTFGRPFSLTFKCYCGEQCTIGKYDVYIICSSCKRMYRWYLERGLERFQALGEGGGKECTSSTDSSEAC